MVVYPIYRVLDCGWREEMVAIMDTEAGAQSLTERLGAYSEDDACKIGYYFYAQTVLNSPEEVIEQLKLIGKV